MNIAGFDILPYSVDSMKVMLSEDGVSWWMYTEYGQDKVSICNVFTISVFLRRCHNRTTLEGLHRPLNS